jgi:cell division protein FtsB
VLLLLAVLIVVGVAALANYGPLRAYRDAQARLDKATSAVTNLADEKTELQSQLAKLSEAGYLETLAREQLAYTREDEELYIVTGLGEESAQTADEAGVAGETDDPAAGSAERPGWIERALSALMSLF